MKSEYDIALGLAQKSKVPTRRVFDLLVSAEKNGDARAAYPLATWYLQGSKFTKKNLILGTEMLQKAAAANVADAIYDLAVSYEKGIVVTRSPQTAFALYMKAALLGEKQSIYEVGRMYYHGIGIGKNRRLAEIWLERAESLGVS